MGGPSSQCFRILAAMATTSYRIGGVGFKREVFVSVPDQAMVIHLSASKPGRVSMEVGLDTPHSGIKAQVTGKDTNTGDGADQTDFDHDGIPNLVEFAFGLDPKQNSAGQLPQPNPMGSGLLGSLCRATINTGASAKKVPSFSPGLRTAL